MSAATLVAIAQTPDLRVSWSSVMTTPQSQGVIPSTGVQSVWPSNMISPAAGALLPDVASVLFSNSRLGSPSNSRSA